MMDKSETIKELAQALAQAQANMPAVQFNATNPFLKNKYADLGAIIAASKPVLATNGLSISQTMTCDDERIGVTTLLMHTSGEWLEDTATLPLGEERGKSLAQVAGSIVTYLRRYGWSAILGMYADEDGDGNGSQPAPRQKPAQKQPVKSNGNGHKPKQEAPKQEAPALRLTPDKLKAAIEKKANETYKGSNPPQTTKGVVVANLEKCFAGSDAKNKRHEFLNWLTGHASIKDVDGAVILSLKDWLSASQDSGGDWQPCDDAIREANAAVREYEKANGQKELI